MGYRKGKFCWGEPQESLGARKIMEETEGSKKASLEEVTFDIGLEGQ